MLWTEPLVICGFGEVGERVAAAAVASGVLPHRISVVEQDDDRLRLAASRGYRISIWPSALGEAIRLLGAGRAGKVVICLSDEFVADAVATVRSGCPYARVEVILSSPERERAVAEAGADLVLSLSRLAGKLLAASVAADAREAPESQ